ncbi:MAG: aminoacyl-tRNA deacylase [Candidatus Hodarchaeales archaeon]
MKLLQYIKENGLTAEIIELKTRTQTVKQAAIALKCSHEDIIKSLVVVTSKTNDFYLVILQGNRKIKTRKLKKLLNVKDIVLASPLQVKKVTGYKIGDIPPISIQLPAILDELVGEQEMNKILYGGGGGPSKLVKISVEELIDCIHPLIADISQPI